MQSNKVVCKTTALLVYSFNPSTPQAEAGGSFEFERPVRSTEFQDSQCCFKQTARTYEVLNMA